MPRSGAEDHLAGESGILGDDGSGQASLAQAGQVNDVGGVVIADQGGDRAERLDLVQLGPARVLGPDEQR